jgi:electron transport complex protein RnfB
MEINHSSMNPADDTPYRELQQHLDRQPIGFPPSRTGADVQLLKHIFSPHEARVATCLRHVHETLDIIYERAEPLVANRAALETFLTAMVKKGGIEIEKHDQQTRYANAPLVVGMYELQLGRLTPEFIADFKAYTSEKRYGISFLKGKHSQLRTIPVQKSIAPHMPAPDYDRIIYLLENANPPFVILPCICREKKAMQGETCQQTDRKETCMAIGSIAHTVIEMDIGRQITRTEAMQIIRENQNDGLVLQPANSREIDFLCSCCGCCCSMLSLQKDLPLPLDFWDTNYQAVLDTNSCVGCGMCVQQCQTNAMTLKPVDKPHAKAVINPHRCIGCGHCVTGCPKQALTLIPRKQQVRPPENRAALNAILLKEKQHLLAPARVIGKLARGIALTWDLRLLQK